jgi:hypothetical protein
MYACTVTCSIEGRNDKSSVHLEREESEHEIDKWSMGDLTLFLKAKGIILKDIPVQHLRQLAKSVSDANLPEYKVIIPTSTDRRTVKYKGKDLIFPNITDSSLSRWTDDLSFLPSIEHVTVHAYILSSADFDLERFKNLRNVKLQATFELLVSLLFNQQEHFTYSYPL